MTDSMKFGPEWLRNMSSDVGGGGQGGQSSGGMSNMFGQNNNNNINSGNNNNSTNNISSISTPRYQLAEYRYGREEMLSLCEKVRIPEILPKYKKLFVEKLNGPLALTPSTDDDAVSYERTLWPVRGVPPNTIGISSRGARGGSIERGRGRGRGSYHSTLGYQRSSSMYDEDARGGGRATWLDRNGSDTSEWNGTSSTSPRKEYITRNSSMESWRRSREDDTSTTSTSTTTIASETWRGIGPGAAAAPTGYKWARSQSWRDEDPSLSHNNNDSRSFNSSSISDRNSISAGGKPSMAANVVRKSLHTWNDDENLPEWAVEDPIEGGGSFDASGAFHGTHEDDDSQVIDCNEKSSRKIATQIGDSNHIKKETSTESVPTSHTLSQKPNQSKSPEKLENTDIVTDNNNIALMNETDKWRPVPQNESANGQNKKIDATVGDANKENSSATVNMANDAKKESIMSNASLNQRMNCDSLVIGNAISDDNQNQQQTLVLSMLQSQQKQQQKLSRPPMSETASVDRMQEVADDMVEKLIMDDEMSSSSGRDSINLLRKKSDNMPPNLQPQNDSQQFTVVPDGRWLYRDPQGKVQGPFTATEMNEWYRLGYFDENLYVRQEYDSHFAALGELVKQRGALPFSSSTPLSHALKNSLSSPHVPHEIPPSNIPQVKTTSTLNPLLPNDSFSLEYQYQYQQQQAEYLKQKRASIRKNLAESDPWPLLTAEQQTDMINQRMANLTDYLIPPTPMGAKQVMPPNLTHKPILKQQQQHSPAASSQQHMFNNHDFIASNPAPSTDPLSTSAMRSMMQQMTANQYLSQSIPIQHQHQPTPPSQPHLQFDAIQSLMLQLAIQSSSTNPVAMQTSNQLSLDKNSSNNVGWMGTNIGVSHQPNLNQQPTNTAGSWQTNRTWSIPMSPIPIAHKQLTNQQQQQQMKTEKQIRDEIKIEEQQKKDDLINWKIPNLAVQQQIAAAQQVAQQVVQQQQQLEKQTIDKQRQEKQKRDADSDKKSKVDDEKQKQSKKDVTKSDNLKKDSKVDEKKKEGDEKKRQRELKKQQAEDDRRRQQEEEKRRQYNEEKKRLEDIAEQRKAKLMEGQRRSQQNDQSQSQQRQNVGVSVAPWSLNPVAHVTKPSLSLAEIQKAERERRAEQSRIEQMIREQQQTQNIIDSQQQKESSQKWNLQPHSVKSLAEIQAEESKRQSIADQIALNSIAAVNASTKKREAEQAQQHFASSIWNTNTATAGPMWNSPKMWSNGNSTSSGGFWEEPTKTAARISNPNTAISSGISGTMSVAGSKPLVKSQTVSNMQQAAAKSTSKLQGNASKPVAKAISSASVSGILVKPPKSGKKDREASENSNHEFNVWCFKALAAHEKVIDVPTFVTFLRDLESPFEVKDYIRMYLGETKECTEFGKQFLERRSKYKNQQRAANAHIDDMCSPAPAITPSNDFQEVKGKGKKEKKKNKMLKLDSRILGFSVTAAQDRLNVGDRDYSYGEAP